MPSTLDLDPRVDPLIGQTLGGKYTLERLIGRGGMGHVYSATVIDTGTGPGGEGARRDVVVKMIAPPLAQQPQAMARFEREAKRLDGLRHSNIVEMYDYGREGGRAYIVMEWVDGELLNDYMARMGRLTLADFVPVAAQVLKGVGHAHSRDLMIRDIKPANVMLCERKGRANFVKIIDFGLAKMLEGDEDITKQHFIGTSGYLSPEQIKGLDIDLRVDVYALGVLFYQMLSGRMPFEAENDTTLLYKHVHDFPTPLSEVLPDGHEVPDELVHLIHDCLEKDPNDRPRDANEIVERLIDCVPMSMFKLPPASPSAAGQTSTSTSTSTSASFSALSTSALNAPTGETAAYLKLSEVDPSASDSLARTSSIGIGVRSARYETSTGELPITGVAAPQPVAQPAGGGSKLGLILGGVAVVAVLAIGGYLVFGDPGADAGTDPAADAAVGAELEATVGEAETLIGDGEFDDAARKLESVRGRLDAAPGLVGKVERLDKKIAVGRLLATAKQLDDQDRTGAALAAYRDVLEVAPSDATARARIAELEAKMESDDIIEVDEVDEEPPEPPADPTADPSGDPSGDPSTDSGESAEPSGSKPKPKPSGTKPKPTPVAQPKPTEPKPAKPEKDNPFLPTKKKQENGPFLPTEK